MYAGKLYQIIGRNRNTYITFGYSWDNGTHTAGGQVSAISATTESGMTATLYFGDVSGHRLLDHITYPDGATTVYYGYDAARQSHVGFAAAQQRRGHAPGAEVSAMPRAA